MKYSRDDELALIERVLSFKHDPLGFVLWVFPWGTPALPQPGPRQWQLDELTEIRDWLKRNLERGAIGLDYEIFRKSYSSGRGPGKSALLAWLALWQQSTHWGAQTIVVANTETQLRSKTFAEIARWVTLAMNAHWFNVEGLKVECAKWFADMAREQLKVDPKYWNIAGQTWVEDDPSSFAGAHNMYGLLQLFDEASGIATPIWDVADGYFTENTPYRFHIAASQMRSSTGRFYDIHNSEKFAATWRTRTLDISKMDELKSWAAGHIALHGEDSDTVRIEVFGKPPKQGDTQVCSPDAINAARNRRYALEDTGEPLILGIDPAPRGRTVARFRQGRNARDCCGRETVNVFQGLDTIALAAKIAALVDRHKPDAIACDSGQGFGLIDVLKHTHNIRVVELTFGSKAQDAEGEWTLCNGELWGHMRDWLEIGMIDQSPELQEDLTKRQWKWHNGEESGKKVLEAKADIKKRGDRSPDDGDALACTFAVRPPRRDAKASRRASRVSGPVDGAYEPSI